MNKRFSILVLLVFLFSAIAFPTPAPTLAAAKKPTFKVTYMTSTAHRGARARVVIKTTPGAKCMLKYKTPLGRVSKAKGLGKTIADTNGMCSWSWFIGTNTTPGTGVIIVTVNKYTEKHPITIT